MLTGCSWITDDLEECPTQLSVSFTYDRNIKFADAFPHEVKAVNIWAFDHTGKLVWSESASGDALAGKDFKLDTNLPEGTYDFISWCGLKDNPYFELESFTPQSKEELEVRLKTTIIDGKNISEGDLPGLYHGMMTGIKYTTDPFHPSLQNVNISLTKDTKSIRFMLQHLDGSPIDNKDFEVTITDENSWLSFDNEIIPGCPVVTYKPWNIHYGEVSIPNSEQPTKAMSSVGSLLFELSTSRLMVDSNVILTVHRKWDNTDIIKIPLVEYLLLIKGRYGDMPDQEYLDRQDDYSMIFFIDQNSNWNIAGGIFINSWAVVPPQNSAF